ncbi:acyl-CoA thioesterase [Paraburkholderia ferrariae]|jgi:acyl-CoA thioester hydrolase|uniref:acyl-CoA thioesterase n=1 Tax=Paraburkholderia ferrariae TaxID=386056 RepID=UPI000483AC3E|nr:acyl-CoA thioesterase [Paraburkholderia ferrariae]
MQKGYFETPIEVKYRDTDSAGHVSSAVYYDYLQHAYLTFMHRLLDLPLSEKLPHIMVKTACEYVQPAQYGDRITVRSSVTRFGSKSFDLEHLMVKADDAQSVVAKAFSTHVMFDYAENATMPVPDSFKRQVAKFQGA